MKTSDKFKEYIWLVNTIHRAGRITLSEIQERWLATDMSEGLELARSTFNRHKEAIQDMFGIYIECDKKNGFCYYIENDEALKEDSVQNWMLSTLTVNNAVSEGLSLQNRILLQSVPFEGDYLEKVMQAMKNRVRIVIEYQKYGNAEVREIELEPYCLKLFKQRWYLLGNLFLDTVPYNESSQRFRVFSFDRILQMHLTENRFNFDKSFSPRDYFRDSFGVFVASETKPERVVLRAFGKEQYYIHDLPVHASQRLLTKGENYTDYELYLRPTMDFCGHILSRSNQLKVLSPPWLVDRVQQMIREALNLYEG